MKKLTFERKINALLRVCPLSDNVVVSKHTRAVIHNSLFNHFNSKQELDEEDVDQLLTDYYTKVWGYNIAKNASLESIVNFCEKCKLDSSTTGYVDPMPDADVLSLAFRVIVSPHRTNF